MNTEIKLVWHVKDLHTGKPCQPKQTLYQSSEEVHQILAPENVFETYEEASTAYVKVEKARLVQLKQAIEKAEDALDTYILNK